MPAAASAATGSEAGPGPGDGTVIRMADHHDRRPRRATADPVPDRSANPAPAPATDDARDHIAHRVEALFTTAGRTLTDPDTAQALALTMAGVLGILDGALAEGLLQPDQHHELRALYEAIRNAPERL